MLFATNLRVLLSEWCQIFRHWQKFLINALSSLMVVGYVFTFAPSLKGELLDIRKRF